MKRLFVYILVFFIIWSCDDIDRPKKPDNLLSKNQMIDIITDISLLNAAKGTDKKLLERNGVNPEFYIFKKYKIDSLQFAENNNYYAYDVNEYEDIYLKVKQRIESKREEFKTLLEIEKKEKDSIRKSKRKNPDSLKKKPDSLKKNRIKKELPRKFKAINPEESDYKTLE